MTRLINFDNKYQFYYSESNDEIDLVKYVGNQSDLVVPSQINGISVTSIHDYCFEDCLSIKTISLPDSIKSLGDGAFHRCLNLEGITLPGSIDSIRKRTFANCVNLKEILFPSGIRSINANSLRNNYGLRHVSIPGTVTRIEDGMFASCHSLETVSLDEGIKEIGSSAFYQCINLTAITLPNSVITLEAGCFSECSKLSQINFSNNLETIGDKAFEKCISIDEICLPESVLTVVESAFNGCSGVKKVIWRGKFNSVDFWPIEGGHSFESIEFGDNVTEINVSRRFNDVKTVRFPVGLKKLTYSVFSEIYAQQSKEDFVILNGSLLIKYKGKDEHVTIPQNVTQLLEHCFSQSQIKSIKFHNDITEIPGFCFEKCLNLNSFEVPSTIKSIRYGAFAGCENLMDLQFNEGLLEIDSRAFSGCLKIKNIQLPDSLKKVGYSLFDEKLKIASITIPPSLTNESVNQSGIGSVPFHSEISEIHFSNPKLKLFRFLNFKAVRYVHFHHANGFLTSFNVNDIPEEYHPFLYTLEFRNSEFTLNIFRMIGNFGSYYERARLVNLYIKYLEEYVIDEFLSPFIYKNTDLSVFDPMEILKELINELKADQVQTLLSNKYIRIYVEDRIESIMEIAVASGSASVVAVLMNTFYTNQNKPVDFQL